MRWIMAGVLTLFCASCTVPRNVIVMISDGCSFNHVLATNFYEDGEAGAQRYQQTFSLLAMSTYPNGRRVRPGERLD